MRVTQGGMTDTVKSSGSGGDPSVRVSTKYNSRKVEGPGRCVGALAEWRPTAHVGRTGQCGRNVREEGAVGPPAVYKVHERTST